MSIILYSRYRRQGLRKAWSLSGMNKTSLHTAIGIVVILFCYVVVSWVETSIENAEKYGGVSGEREAAEAKQNTEKAYKMLATCMNGGALMVSGTNDAIFCDRASYQKGL